MPTLTDPNEPYFKDGIWGWDGTVWRRLPLVWGYSDRWQAARTGTAVGAGNAVAITIEVPEGEVYVLQHLAFQHDAAAAKRVTVYLVTPTGDTPIYDIAAATANVWYTLQREATLKHEDTVQALCYAPADAKRILLRVWGYKMLVAE